MDRGRLRSLSSVSAYQGSRRKRFAGGRKMTTTHVSNEDIIVEHDAPWSRELGQPNGKDNHVVNGEDRGEALITELASLRDLAYQHRRTAAAIELKIGVGVLDKIVKQRRAELE